MVLYVGVVIALFVLYARVVTLARRGELDDPAVRTFALAIPIVFAAILTLAPPCSSIDVYTYVVQGDQTITGKNPYVEPAKSLSNGPLRAELISWGWIPVHGVSPYGPLWTDFEASVRRVSSSVLADMLMLKISVTLVAVGCGWLIWSILGQTWPRRQLAGTVLYAWNPAVLMEFSSEGHNDAVVLFCVLLSLWLCIRRRETAGLVTLGVGTLVKITSAVVAPFTIAYAWRTYRERFQLVKRLGVAAGVIAALTAFSLLPVWAGSATFDGLRAHARPSILPSTQGVLYWWLTRSHSEGPSARLVSSVMTGALLIYGASLLRNVKDEASLLHACALFSVAYLFVAPGYWPWYATLPIALLALTPSGSSVAALVAISLASRLVAPVDDLRLDRFMDWEHEMFVSTIVGIWLPAVSIGALGVQRLRRARNLTIAATLDS